jgi:hypothetical protein
LVQSILLLFCALFAEEGDGVGGKGSGDITIVEIETLLEVFLSTFAKL